MCGIAGILYRKTSGCGARDILAMSRAIAHRGPDGEGFISYSEGRITTHFAPDAPAAYGSFKYSPSSPLNAAGDVRMLLAHRRLSILDLSEAGHQPMCDATGRTWITFNGEIYNYIELRKELEASGHTFVSGTDTEVILHAYSAWGTACVERFNGMWAFCIFDAERNKWFISRDRFGVKPFYYIQTADCIAFASEQKAFSRSGLLAARASEHQVYQYLVNGSIERSADNFFRGVHELWPGYNLEADLETMEIRTSRWFDPESICSAQRDALPDDRLIAEIRDAVISSVTLRMRSDVQVGCCLSGGIDSSAIALIMRGVAQPVHCFTSVFPGFAGNEEPFADSVAAKVSAIHYKSTPTAEDFMKDADDLVYALDAPIWDTSTYAQFRLMKLASQNGVKVLLDGQGADELFTGYHHHYIAKWKSLMATGRLAALMNDIHAAGNSLQHPWLFFAKRLVAAPLLRQPGDTSLLRPEYVRSEKREKESFLTGVNAQLLDDITRTRLKTFLRCEDRCGMWHGVESRTPFSDDPNLISLAFSFDGNRKIRSGNLKYLLREAMKNDLPKSVYERRDKRGFETPMQQWIAKYHRQMKEEVREAGWSFVDEKNLMIASPENRAQNKLLFKLFVLTRWNKVFATTAASPADPR